jgi:hypothetical protein
MVNANLIFCTCDAWQDFANNDLVIKTGQPVVKADRHSLLLPIEERCDLVMEAYVRVTGFQIRRLYLPLSIDQVALFLGKYAVSLEVKFQGEKTTVKTDKYKFTDKDWYKAAASLIQTMQRDGVFK